MLKTSLLGWLFFSCFMHTMDVRTFTTALDQERYKVLTIVRDYVRGDTAVLSKEGLEPVLISIGERLSDDQLSNEVPSSLPIFVVFNEYACSRQTLEYNHFRSLLDCVIEHSRKQEWLPCFCYINFLYKLQRAPPTDDVEWLKSYLGNSLTDFMIDGKNFPRHTWPNVGMRESANMQEALRNEASSYFANETFVVHRGNIISRYRKATYFNEDPVLIQKGWIYFFGRGYDEPTNERGALAHELVNRVGTDICRDVCSSF